MIMYVGKTQQLPVVFGGLRIVLMVVKKDDSAESV